MLETDLWCLFYIYVQELGIVKLIVVFLTRTAKLNQPLRKKVYYILLLSIKIHEALLSGNDYVQNYFNTQDLTISLKGADLICLIYETLNILHKSFNRARQNNTPYLYVI
jgi:hypothetical protein